ncbi:acetone carboxylase subunit gamma [Pseudaminobacter soli (ex Li et al. 2025)]|uniref:acetone carboxylase subunit gamma n=1 Tax=Pseudaminobacter soli (ex Li et al. 2025) TaxID=1295366 RepID=UPI0011B27750|nr:acetone carboxylase subunit gamma [Mesorhizobium soli]
MSGKYTNFILPTVAVEGSRGAGQAYCATCATALGEPGAHWKTGSVLTEVALADIPGGGYDTGFPGVFLRHFCCPNCGELLDTETSEAGEPALADALVLS